MAVHRLIVQIDVEVHNELERPRAGQAFINQLSGRVAKGLVPRVIHTYVKDPGAIVTLQDTNVPNVTVDVTIEQDPI